MKDNYRDRTFAILDKVTEALERKEITREEATLILGAALQKEARELVRQEMAPLLNTGRRYKKALFLNYSNELTYGQVKN